MTACDRMRNQLETLLYVTGWCAETEGPVTAWVVFVLFATPLLRTEQHTSSGQTTYHGAVPREE